MAVSTSRSPASVRHVEMSMCESSTPSSGVGSACDSSSVRPSTRRYAAEFAHGSSEAVEVGSFAVRERVEVRGRSLRSVEPRPDATNDQVLDPMAIEHLDDPAPVGLGAVGHRAAAACSCHPLGVLGDERQHLLLRVDAHPVEGDRDVVGGSRREAAAEGIGLLSGVALLHRHDGKTTTDGLVHDRPSLLTGSPTSSDAVANKRWSRTATSWSRSSGTWP